MKKNLLGFTLIELMIAISIVAVLSTIALVVYSSIQSKGRDAKRQSDLGVIQSALEQYHSDQNVYPSSLGTSITFSGPPAVTYLSTVPQDPQQASGHLAYCYLPTTPNPTSYSLYAKLENPPTGGVTYICNSINTYNYQVKSP